MKKSFKNIICFLLIGMLTFVLVGCTNNRSEEVVQSDSKDIITTNEGKLKISFIDVGQADSILIQCDNQNMLIDAGNNDDDKLVEKFLRDNGVNKIDYVIGTHPHEDHIGGLDYIINKFDIGNVLMPKKTATTKTFKDVVKALNEKGLKPIAPGVGYNFNVGKAKATVLAPQKEYEDTNDASIVIKLDYMNNSFIFTGDAEAISEKDIINSKVNLKADVLKLGHHGSRTSTSEEFLKKVNPKYAIITCGKNNDYGHPHKETLEKLNKFNIPFYRTDEQGTIILTSDGSNISFNKDTTSLNSGLNENVNKGKEKENKVYFTQKGKSYHLTKECSALKNSKNILVGTLEDAIQKGKSDPCDRCALN